jgi:hypothetical protein
LKLVASASYRHIRRVPAERRGEFAERLCVEIKRIWPTAD